MTLSVKDSGIGISPEMMSRIFEPFFTTKEVGKGTGLGLAMVYGIVQQSCGHIVVDSRPPAGTSFKIFFPVVRQEMEAGAGKSAVRRAPGGNETILLVEDEDPVRKFGAKVQNTGEHE